MKRSLKPLSFSAQWKLFRFSKGYPDTPGAPAYATLGGKDYLVAERVTSASSGMRSTSLLNSPIRFTRPPSWCMNSHTIAAAKRVPQRASR